MSLAFSPYEGTPEFTTSEYEDEVERLQSLEPSKYETVEVPAWYQNNELGIIYNHPYEPVTDQAVVLVSGLGASRGAYRGLLKAMTEQGYPSIVIKSPRKQNLKDAVKFGHIKNPTIFQSQGLHEMYQSVHNSDKIKRLRSGKRLTNFVLACHSNGTVIGAQSAYHERIRKPNGNISIDQMISIGGAGQNRMGLVAQIPTLPALGSEVIENFSDIRESAGDNFTQDAAEHLARSIIRFGREALYVGSRQSYVMDKIDTARESGMLFGGLVLNDDAAFDGDKLSASLEGHTNYMKRVEGPHVLPNSRPREFAPHLAIAINRLNEIAQANHNKISWL